MDFLTVRSRTDGGRSVFTDLSVLLNVPLSVESMSPERTSVGIGLVIPFAVRAFEDVGAWLAFLGFKSRWVNFIVSFATPPKFSMMLRFMRAVTFDALGSLNATRKS